MTNPASKTDLAKIADLHPTQITVGFREVAQKRLRWRSRVRKAGREGTPRVPVVLGPSGGLYLIDRHHLACAVKEEGLDEVLIRQVADLSALAPQDIWHAPDARGWCHPYDADGRHRPLADIPSTINALLDAPYRSLASTLRRAGGCAKKLTPFSEFAWADFLRQRLSSDALAMDFEGALDRALMARTPTARDLPGWRPEPAASLNATVSLASPHAFR